MGNENGAPGSGECGGEGPELGSLCPSPSSLPQGPLSSIVLLAGRPYWDHPEAMLPESVSQLCAPQQAGFLSQRKGMVR